MEVLNHPATPNSSSISFESSEALNHADNNVDEEHQTTKKEQVFFYCYY